MHIKNILDATGLFGIIAKIELYNGVILAYDQDLDERLKEAVDRIDLYFRRNLQVMHECDGSLTMIWKDDVPECFTVGNSIAVTYPDDDQFDYWQIDCSISSQKIAQDYKNNSFNALHQFSLN